MKAELKNVRDCLEAIVATTKEEGLEVAQAIASDALGSIPTPADCAKWERFESAIHDLEVQTRPDMNMADRSVNAALFRILAALDTKEQA